MQTTRIGGIVTSSPNTQWWMGADWIGQNYGANYSTLRVSLTCANGPSGSTGSFTNSPGTQYTWWGGGELQRHNFSSLPSGYAQNQTRWDEASDHNFYHDSQGFLGSVAFGMHVNYGTTSGDWYGSIPAPARIPKPPSAVQGLSISAITPSSIAVNFSQPADNRGASIDGFKIDVYEINGSNPLVQSIWTVTGTANPVSGLKPAQRYDIYVYAHNSQGYGDQATATATTLSGAYVSNGTAWVAAGVYESDGANWLTRVVQVSNGTTWQNAL